MRGVPGLSPEEASRVAQSREIHRRSRELFKAVAAQGGVAVFEQPPSSVAWLEPENFQCLKAFHGHLAWVDACQHGVSFAKSWCFASNNPCIQHVAARCNRPKKHASIAGVRSDRRISRDSGRKPCHALCVQSSTRPAGTRASKTLHP